MAWRAVDIARRSLSGFASQILADGTGGTLVLFHDRLVALGADLATRWERPQRTPLHLLPSPRGPLFLGKHGIEVLAPDGGASTIVPVGGRDASEEGRVLAQLEGGFVIAHGQTLRYVDDAGRDYWPPRHLASIPERALAAGDRLLVLTRSVEYWSWGYLGPALLVGLHDGAVIAELRGDRAAVTDDGRFVLGLEGYDVFDTWLHGADGALVCTWRSAGHAVPDPGGGIRVIECDRTIPTSSRIVRLELDGSIRRGPELAEGQASAPVTLGDGTAVFVDAGVLRAVDRGLVASELARLMDVPPGEIWRYSASLADGGDAVFVAVRERQPDGEPIAYTTHVAAIRLVAR